MESVLDILLDYMKFESFESLACTCQLAYVYTVNHPNNLFNQKKLMCEYPILANYEVIPTKLSGIFSSCCFLTKAKCMPSSLRPFSTPVYKSKAHVDFDVIIPFHKLFRLNFIDEDFKFLKIVRVNANFSNLKVSYVSFEHKLTWVDLPSQLYMIFYVTSGFIANIDVLLRRDFVRSLLFSQ